MTLEYSSTRDALTIINLPSWTIIGAVIPGISAGVAVSIRPAVMPEDGVVSYSAPAPAEPQPVRRRNTIDPASRNPFLFDVLFENAPSFLAANTDIHRNRKRGRQVL
jgi:hypothetical protein